MRLFRLLVVPALVAATALGFQAARADDLDVPALLTSAKTSFEAKKYGKALADLQLAAGEMSRLRLEGLQQRLPAAPAGWTAEEQEGNAGLGLLGMGGFTTVRRRYTKGEATSIQAEVYADAAVVVGPIQMLMSNAGFLQGTMKVVTIKGRKALLDVRAEQKSGSLTLLLNSPNSMLKLEGDGIAKADIEALAAAFDLDALEKAISE